MWRPSQHGGPYELWREWDQLPGLLRLVAAGTLAANPHNIQPWSFVVGEHAIDLYAEPERSMPLGDADGRERVAGFGCAIENVVVAGRRDGLDVRVWPWPDDDPDHVARIEVTDGVAPTERERSLAEAIASRHTNRGPFGARAVSPELLVTLAEDAPDGAELVWVTEQAAVAEVGEVFVEATRAIVDDRDMSAEAFSWFRDGRADIERFRDGLTLDGQGMSGPVLAMAKLLPAQSREGADAFWVKAARATHTATARAYGIVRVDDTADRHARLAGGRLLERVHLAATVAGLSLQHMNQVTERIARDAALGAPDRFSERWARATGVGAGQSLLAFRVGYGTRPARPSPRRTLGDVVRNG